MGTRSCDGSGVGVCVGALAERLSRGDAECIVGWSIGGAEISDCEDVTIASMSSALWGSNSTR